jgi:hypothetical protein
MHFYSSQPGARRWWRHQGSGLFDPESEFWRLVDSEMQKHDEAAA